MDVWLPIVVVIVVAVFALIISYPAMRFGWYASLEKSPYHYTNWFYSPLWYIFYGIYAWVWYRLVVNETSGYRAMYHLMFIIALGLILFWLIMFLYWRKPYESIIMLIGAIIIVAIIMLFSLHDPPSIILLSLLMVWLLYLIYITWEIDVMNPHC